MEIKGKNIKPVNILRHRLDVEAFEGAVVLRQYTCQTILSTERVAKFFQKGNLALLALKSQLESLLGWGHT